MSDRPTMLGTYPVERELGRGGMGVVYLARDSRLERSVAIKVLPDAFARDPERLARFEREARILASLNHPNIAGIFGIEEAEGRRLLVLEYVPGDTLATRTARGALPLDEALDVCRQIAVAVEAAHEGGVIHRDLKPGNIKITPDGLAKVLDFGLARASTASASGSDLSQSPTVTYAATGAGVILGTAAYMSPEQARGKTVEKRTDIWSFGCVLYECLTGRQVFAGETVSDTIAKILEREPDWAALPAQTPAKVRDLLHRCLEKDPKRRLRDIGDARLELEEAVAARSTAARVAAAAAAAKTRAAWSPRTIGMAALLLVVGAAAGIGLWSTVGPGARGPRGGHSGPVRFSIAIPPRIRAFSAVLAPDGRTVVILGRARTSEGVEEPVARLYVRRLDEFDIRPIPGTEGVLQFGFSPDGRWLAFVAALTRESSQRRLAKVPLDDGSPPIALAEWNDAWSLGTWLHDGDILITTDVGTRFFRLPSGGGAPKPAVKFEAVGFTGSLSPGNRLPKDRAVFLSSFDPGSQVSQWLLDPRTGRASPLLENAGGAVYSPTGHVVFTRGEALLAAPFDLGRLRIGGDVVALSSGVRTSHSGSHGRFSLAGGGNLLYPPGGQVDAQRRLAIVDAAGKITPVSGDRRSFETPGVSRDARRVAVVVPNAKALHEIWASDLERPAFRRLVALPGADCMDAVWSPDAREVAFDRTARDSLDGVYISRTDADDPPRLLLKNESPLVFLWPTSWAPDGSGLLVTRARERKGDILFVPRSPGSEAPKPRSLRVTPYDESGARFSTDGRLVAFVSDESGKHEIHIAPYQADGSLGTAVMVSSGGGRRPRWSGDGRRLFYYSDPDRLMSVTVSREPALSASDPLQVHDLRKLRATPEFDILPDGRLLIIQKGEEEDDIAQFDVVLNWTEELRERMVRARAGRR